LKMMVSADFDVKGMYAALEAQRISRGMSWQQVAREINGFFERVPARPISPSTIVRTREGGIVEGDGALQMLRWLGRTPESFMPGMASTAVDCNLPSLGPHQILRFDAKAIYAALDAQRMERKLTWPQVASEIGGFTASGLKRLESEAESASPLSCASSAGWGVRPRASRALRIGRACCTAQP
jgi:hypothetical protein